MLVLQVNEVKRSVAVAQKNMPNKRALDNELVTLQLQVGYKRLILILNLPPRTPIRLSVRFLRPGFSGCSSLNCVDYRCPRPFVRLSGFKIPIVQWALKCWHLYHIWQPRTAFVPLYCVFLICSSKKYPYPPPPAPPPSPLGIFILGGACHTLEFLWFSVLVRYPMKIIFPWKMLLQYTIMRKVIVSEIKWEKILSFMLIHGLIISILH